MSEEKEIGLEQVYNEIHEMNELLRAQKEEKEEQAKAQREKEETEKAALDNPFIRKLRNYKK